MTYFITIAGAPAGRQRENIQNGQGHSRLGSVPGAHLGDGICPATPPWRPLAQLRCAAIRNALTGAIQPAPRGPPASQPAPAMTTTIERLTDR